MNKFDEKCDKLLNEKDNTKEYCKKNGIETEKNRNGDTIVVGTEKLPHQKREKIVSELFPKSKKNGMGTWKVDKSDKSSPTIAFGPHGLKVL